MYIEYFKKEDKMVSLLCPVLCWYEASCTVHCVAAHVSSWGLVVYCGGSPTPPLPSVFSSSYLVQICLCDDCVSLHAYACVCLSVENVCASVNALLSSC